MGPAFPGRGPHSRELSNRCLAPADPDTMTPEFKSSGSFSSANRDSRIEERTGHMAEQGHGHSRAAWTAVTILLVASFLISLAVVITSWPLAIVGIALIVVGVAAGKVLAMAGFGQAKPKHSGSRTAVR